MILLSEILHRTQNSLFNYVLKYTQRYEDAYMKVVIDKKWILMIPRGVDAFPLLTCHLDVVGDDRAMKYRKKKYNIDSNYVVSLTDDDKKHFSCLGGDDRCGVSIACGLIPKNLGYGFLFTTDEEIGGLGVKSFVDSMIVNRDDTYDITKDITCIISLDRRSPKGEDEVATYGYDNKELLKVFTDRGYTEGMGSYTDCVDISEAYNIACVNLSVGYDNEHTTSEVIYLYNMYHTFNVLNDKQLVLELTKDTYKAEVSDYYDDIYSLSEHTLDEYNTFTRVSCDVCGAHAPLYSSVHYGTVCKECVKEFFEWSNS